MAGPIGSRVPAARRMRRWARANAAIDPASATIAATSQGQWTTGKDVAVAIRLVRLAGVAAMMPAATNAPTIDHRGRLRLAVPVLGAGVSCTSSTTVRSSRMSRSHWQLPQAPSPRSNRAFAPRREQGWCFHRRYTSPRHRLQGQECAPQRPPSSPELVVSSQIMAVDSATRHRHRRGQAP
jgi:hypothetical protein